MLDVGVAEVPVVAHWLHLVRDLLSFQQPLHGAREQGSESTLGRMRWRASGRIVCGGRVYAAAGTARGPRPRTMRIAHAERASTSSATRSRTVGTSGLAAAEALSEAHTSGNPGSLDPGGPRSVISTIRPKPRPPRQAQRFDELARIPLFLVCAWRGGKIYFGACHVGFTDLRSLLVLVGKKEPAPEPRPATHEKFGKAPFDAAWLGVVWTRDRPQPAWHAATRSSTSRPSAYPTRGSGSLDSVSEHR